MYSFNAKGAVEGLRCRFAAERNLQTTTKRA
jgi:hypothetical protein